MPKPKPLSASQLSALRDIDRDGYIHRTGMVSNTLSKSLEARGFIRWAPSATCVAWKVTDAGAEVLRAAENPYGEHLDGANNVRSPD